MGAEMASDQVLTIVVPVFNEVRTLRMAIDRLLATELPVAKQVIVVDDGSTDGSVETICDLVQTGEVELLTHPTNRGKGAAVRTAIDVATGDILTILDADMEYSPRDYVALLAPILDGDARVVYGTRTYQGHTAYSFWYVLGNRAVNIWASFLFNSWLSDVETCFKVANTELWRRAQIRSDGFGLEPEVTGKFLKAGERIYEVPINYAARTREQGKKLRWVDGVAALLILLRVRLFGR
jgi:dolichol-phosphate hexosyltransferase